MITPIEDALPALLDLARQHLQREANTPVRAPKQPDTLRANMDIELGETGQPFAETVETLRKILAATPSTASDRFFNQLFAGRDGAAVLGDLLATILNNSMYTYKVAGIHVLIELELVQRMAQLMGFDNAEGVFTTGGSQSNLVGMMVARNEAAPHMREGGNDGRVMRVYTSAESHYSVPKAASILGVGRSNIVRIGVDDRGRMNPELLNEAILQDIAAGHTPMMINATSGTTVRGAFDPLHAIADVAEQHGIWLHIDAAYGGSMIFHPEFEPHLSGSKRADSITWDAHKMMGVPLTCSVILVRQHGLLTKHFDEPADYLFQDDTDELNPGKRSMQCGRRNSTLKLWTAWKTHGDVGFRERVETLRALTMHARHRVMAATDMTLTCEPESLNLCFSVDGVDAATLCRVVNRDGGAMVGHATVLGKKVVRAVFLNPAMTTADVDTLFEVLRAAAKTMRES